MENNIVEIPRCHGRKLGYPSGIPLVNGCSNIIISYTEEAGDFAKAAEELKRLPADQKSWIAKTQIPVTKEIAEMLTQLDAFTRLSDATVDKLSEGTSPEASFTRSTALKALRNNIKTKIAALDRRLDFSVAVEKYQARQDRKWKIRAFVLVVLIALTYYSIL